MSSAKRFTFRELQPSDSGAVVALNTEFDGDMTTHYLVDAYTSTIHGSEQRTIGVVVETEGYEGIAGMGTVRFSEAQFNGQVYPLAFLDNLKVRPEYRGQGLGYQIASWRIARARAELGDGCLIATGMLVDNHASRAVAKKWSAEFIEPMIIFVLPGLSKPPKPQPGITTRLVEPRDFEEFAARQNAFFADYNLYPPADAQSISNKLAISPGGTRPYQFFVAADAAGNLLAGAQTWFRGAFKKDVVNRPPTPLKVANAFLHLLPPDFTIRDAAISGLWYAPGQSQAAHDLVEMIRWYFGKHSAMIAAGFDARDPAQKVLPLKPWYQPRPQIAIGVHGPAPVDRSRLMFVQGRV